MHAYGGTRNRIISMARGNVFSVKTLRELVV